MNYKQKLDIRAGASNGNNVGFVGTPESVIRAIADKYIHDHPQTPFVLRVSSLGAFIRDAECRYVFDLDAKLPQLLVGQYVYVWGKIFSATKEEKVFSISCFSPVRLYLNGELGYKSGIDVEVFPERKTTVVLMLQAGWNHFILEFEKTGTGCGGKFGTGMLKRNPLHFLVPSLEREGQEGWIYTQGLDKPLVSIPSEGILETDSAIEWLPRQDWINAAHKINDLGRMYGTDTPRAVSYSWTRLYSAAATAANSIVLTGCHAGELTIFLDSIVIFQADSTDGTFAVSIPAGTCDANLVIRSVRTSAAWYFELAALPDSVCLMLPADVQGAGDEIWLHLGPFSSEDEVNIHDLCRTDHLFMARGQGAYWQLGYFGAVIRPFVEAENYGRWNYPLGVTLLGLLKAGVALDEKTLSSYAHNHISQCTAYDLYALWDQEVYGASGVNHQLARIDSLDDCGSFGSTMLFAMEHDEVRGGSIAAIRIAEYIAKVQDRLPNGTLFRGENSQGIKNQTMWCDDLYMSVPFLVRYYKRTGEQRWLDDACAQLLAYRRYLYMPDRMIMSHVYDFKFSKVTGIPWGRGNGWAYFALSELLAELPEGHPQRMELLFWFRDFSQGIASLQGLGGLWHQLLDDSESYPETSCTAMFIYGLAKGIRLGWIDDPDGIYGSAVHKGWAGLMSYAVDQKGNVYGVCRGSGYSFSNNYYKHELPWRLNDTHGIGIVLLAGVEYLAYTRHSNLQKNAIAENKGIGYSE